MRSRLAQSRAITLRKESTDAERYLWSHLRRRQLGVRFRRQVPLGQYIVDFACIEAGIVIELDGGQHADDGTYDRVRSQQLEAAGFRVLRFWNNQVFEEIEGVMDAIARALNAPPP